MKNHNSEQDIKIEVTKKEICWIKREMAEIRLQVFNHLPTQIKETKDEMLRRINSLENKILYGFVGLIASVTITQIILKLFI